MVLPKQPNENLPELKHSGAINFFLILTDKLVGKKRLAKSYTLFKIIGQKVNTLQMRNKFFLVCTSFFYLITALCCIIVLL